MNVTEAMKDRFSCRKFTDEQLTGEELDAILEAGRIAPSACNNQPWRFIVLQGDDLAKVDACSKCRYNAPTAILVCFNKDESAKNPDVTPDYGWIDSGLAIMQMALEAQSLGLASCIVGAYDPMAARKAMNIPDNLTTYQFLMLGHAENGPMRMHFDRRPMSEIVVRGGF